MLWKTLIFLAAVTVVLAGKVKRHQTSYEFHIKHDYDYNHHKKHEHEVKHEPEQQEEQEQNEDNKEVEQEENKSEEEQVQQEGEKKEEGEQQNEGEGTESHKPEHHDDDKYSAYEFLYKVEDHHKHDIKGHHEKKDGEGIKGAYWLWQPDGYKRTVKYEADKHNGFKAEVDYSKIEDHHDQESEKQEEGHHQSKSQYYITVYHGLKKPTPIVEEVNEEQDKQEESAQHIPIYVI